MTEEVMMPMSKPEALQHIEITVLRQMGENIAAQTRHLEDLSKDVRDVRERVIRIEARETEKDVEALEQRVKALEDSRSQVRGVAAFGAWLAQSAPWLLAGILAAIALIKRG